MVKTIQINEIKFQVTDSQVFFGRNGQGTWGVYDAFTGDIIANYLDDYEMAESTAFQYVCKMA